MRRGFGLVLLVLAPAVLAGCLDDEAAPTASADASGGAASGPTGSGAAGATRVNFTTAYVAGAPSTATLTGSVKPGSFPSPAGFCCWFEWLDGSSVLPSAPGPAQLRVTLAWTNDAANRANLDVAACMPYHCGFDSAPDQSQATGAQTEVGTFITGRYPWWERDYRIGVRYSDALLTAELPFTLTIEVAPLERALTEAHRFTVPEGGNVTAEIVAPLTDGAAKPQFLVLGPDHRPFRYYELDGPHGHATSLALPPGDYTIAPMAFNGGLVRLHADRPVEEAALRLLPLEEEVVTVADVASPVPATGAFDYAAPPGVVALWPWFEYADGPMLQPPSTVQQRSRVESSTGVLAESAVSRLGLRLNGEQHCLWCNGNGAWDGAKMLDDDGTYSVTYDGTGALGRFVLFVTKYAP